MTTPAVKKAAPKKVAAPRKAAPKKAPAVITEAHKKDLKLIADTMKSVAEDNDLCEIFFETVDALNKKLLSPITVQRPTKNCRVRFTVMMIGNWLVTNDGGTWGGVDCLPDATETEIELAVRNLARNITGADSTCIEDQYYEIEQLD